VSNEGLNHRGKVLLAWAPAVAGYLAAAWVASFSQPSYRGAIGISGIPPLYWTAILQVLEVLTAAAVPAWVVSRLLSKHLPKPALTWRIASRAAWFVPLVLFLRLRIGWASIVAVLAGLGIVRIARMLTPAVQQSPLWSSGGKAFSCVVAGACLEFGVMSTIVERATNAAMALGVATLILAWHVIKPGPRRERWRGGVIVFVAAVLASGGLVHNVYLYNQGYYLGFPVDPALYEATVSLKKAFGGGDPLPSSLLAGQGDGKKKKDVSKSGQSDVKIAGLAHQGILLWPEVKREVTLVPPLPNLGRKVFGKDRATPLDIPFYGVYWFFRPPFSRPPPESITVYGSPAVRRFVNNDLRPLNEEARQNLQRSFDVSCCSRIQVEVTNADPQADRVSLELKLSDSLHAGQRPLSLGRKDLKTRVFGGIAIKEMLEFTMPAKGALPIKTFDEVAVRFHLEIPRQHDSARVSIERFRLIPKRGR
jgi:hypothetical protein